MAYNYLYTKILNGRNQSLWNVDQSSTRIYQHKESFKLKSGDAIHDFYTDQSLSKTIRVFSPGYKQIYLSNTQTFVDNSFTGNANTKYYNVENSPFTNTFSQYYIGSYLKEGIFAPETPDTSAKIAFIHGQGENDYVIFPLKKSDITSIKDNKLGITKIETGGGTYLVTGVNTVHFIDESVDLNKGIASNTSGSSVDRIDFGPGAIGKGSNINNSDNLLYTPQHPSNIRIPGDYDFKGGQDIAILPFNSSKINVLNNNGSWMLLGNGLTSEYTNLEYIQFLDKAYEIKNGQKSEIKFANQGTSYSPVIPISPTYSLSTSASNYNEGQSLITTAQTTNVAQGTRLYWNLSGNGINAGDFSSGSLKGSSTVSSNGSFSFSHLLKNDQTTEGAETLNIKLYSDSARTNQVGSTTEITINDTSMLPAQTPTYALSTNRYHPSTTSGSYVTQSSYTSPAISLNEGHWLQTTAQTTNVAQGTKLYWSLSGPKIDRDDFNSFAYTWFSSTVKGVDTGYNWLNGSSTVKTNQYNNTGNFSFRHRIKQDNTTEGAETLNIKLYSDSARTNQIGKTATVTIEDTSKGKAAVINNPSYFAISGANVVEGQTAMVQITRTGDTSNKIKLWVGFKTQNSTAQLGQDYNGNFTRTLSFGANEKSKTVAIKTTDDNKQESDEHFTVKISSSDSRAKFSSTSAKVTIRDNDAQNKSTTPTKLTNDYLQFSTPKGTQRPTGAMGKYYDYVDRYPLTLKQAFITDYRSGKTASQHLWGQKHWLNNGSKQGRVLQVKTGKEDTNDYGAYVENYGTTLLDEYRKDSRATINGGKLSLFNWGKDHYNTMGKARGRQIDGGADFGAIIKLNSSLYARWQDARIANPALTAFDFGYRNQNVIKQTLGVKLGRDTKEKLTGQYVYSLGGNDVLTGTSGNDILSGGFNDDIIANGMGGEDTVYGGPGRDVFRLNTGGKLNIRDYRAGDDFIQLGDGISESDIQMSFNGFNNTTSFQSGSEVLATVYGTNPNSFSFAQQSDGIDNVFI